MLIRPLITSIGNPEGPPLLSRRLGLMRSRADRVPIEIVGLGPTANQGGGTQTVVHPSNLVAGNLITMAVINKYPPNGPTTPTGWTKNVQASGGAGAAGAGTGNVFATSFSKVATGLETDLTLSTPSANSTLSRMVQWKLTRGGTWSVAGAVGSDNSAGPGFSAAMDVDPGIQAGDVVITQIGLNASGSGNPADVTLVAPGCIFASASLLTNAFSTWGDDCQMALHYFVCLYGQSTGVATVTATFLNTPAGAATIVRLRRV